MLELAANPFTCWHNQRGDMTYDGPSARCNRCERTWRVWTNPATGNPSWWTEPEWPKKKVFRART